MRASHSSAVPLHPSAVARLPFLARLMALAAVSTGVQAQSTLPAVELVSTLEDPMVLGAQPILDARACQLSRDGRVVLFTSEAWNLVPDDRNREADIFVRNRITGELRRVLGSGGAELTNNPTSARLSGDGRWVAFVTSEALVTADTNGAPDVYVWNRNDGSIELVSRTATGEAVGGGEPDLSFDGRYVGFQSVSAALGAGSFQQMFRLDRDTDTLVMASVSTAGVASNGTSDRPRLVGSRYLAFDSLASDLVAGDSNTLRDVFVRDFVAGTTRRLSVDSAGNQLALASSLLGAGIATVPMVQFSTSAVVLPGDSNLTTDLFRIRLDNGNLTHTSPRLSGGFRASGFITTASTTGDGSRALWAGFDGDWDPTDTNGAYDVFATSNAGTAVWLSNSPSTGPGNGSSSSPCGNGDGTVIGFQTDADNLVSGDSNGVGDVLICDTDPCVPERVALAEAPIPVVVDRDDSSAPDVSADARYVVFATHGALLAAGTADQHIAPDIVLRDRVAATNLLLTPGDATGDDPVVSDDGRYVAFLSYHRPPLFTGTNQQSQAFLYDRVAGTTTLISKNATGTPGTARVFSIAISGDGSTVVFDTASGNLVPGDVNGRSDVFIYAVASGALTRVAPSTTGFGGGEDPRVSRDGQRIVFLSYDSDYVVPDTAGTTDAFLYDRSAQTFIRLSSVAGNESDNDSLDVDISADGNTAVFTSIATNLMPPPGSFGRERIYRVAATGGALEPIGRRPDGAALGAGDDVYGARLSHDGSVVVHFGDFGSLLAPGNTSPAQFNGLVLRSAGAGPVDVISTAPGGRWIPNTDSGARAIAIDASGNQIVLVNDSGDFLPALDHNEDDDVYLLTHTPVSDAMFANGFE